MTPLKIVKNVTDPVHGSIGLTQVEVDLMGTPAFQRLRGIKHLGLVHLVYPGADFSRFSHSLGVCHVTGKILASLEQNHRIEIPKEDKQAYRLAALLHDVGHYPFSHPMEQALDLHFQDRSAQSLVIGNDEREVEEAPGETYLRHEEVSSLIITTDPEVSTTIKGADVDPKDVAAIISRSEPPLYANLVSSDLDADRIDYMLRTAVHAGLPYGRVDVEYLVRQLCLDEGTPPKLCLPSKALRSAEHFLFARFFEYSQVLVHKTVAGMEQVLKDAVQGLLAAGAIKCDREEVRTKIARGDWWSFDDSYVWELLRSKLSDASLDPLLRRRIECLVHRSPPVLVGEVEFYASREEQTKSMVTQLIQKAIGSLAVEFKIDKQYFFLWESSKAVTKAPASLRYSDSLSGEADEDQLAQVIHILPSGAKESIPITDCSYSAMKLFAEKPHNLIRLYLIDPGQGKLEKDKMRVRLKDLVKIDGFWK